MFSILCLVVAQAATVAPPIASRAGGQEYKSIVIQRVASNTAMPRTRRQRGSTQVDFYEPPVEALNTTQDDPRPKLLEPIPEPVLDYSDLPLVTSPKPKTPEQSSVKPAAVSEPRRLEIRDPARVSWLDRFSFDEVRVESSHTDFGPIRGQAQPAPRYQLPRNMVPMPQGNVAPSYGNGSSVEPPVGGASVVRPPQVPNTPYRPYRFPESPEQYRASMTQNGGLSCTGCGRTLSAPNARCTNSKCGCAK